MTALAYDGAAINQRANDERPLPCYRQQRHRPYRVELRRAPPGALQKALAERATARKWVGDGSQPARARDPAYDAANFYSAEITAAPGNGDWHVRYFDQTRRVSLERQFWVGVHAKLPERQLGMGMNSGLTPEEVAFRKARAALKPRKQVKLPTPVH